MAAVALLEARPPSYPSCAAPHRGATSGTKATDEEHATQIAGVISQSRKRLAHEGCLAISLAYPTTRGGSLRPGKLLLLPGSCAAPARVRRMIDSLRREFDRKLQVLVEAGDIVGIRALASTQASQAGAVRLQPYPEPEDMAESMGNDFADDLFRHYNDTTQLAEAAAARLEAAAA